MLLTCDNKGCYAYGEHKLDVDSGSVICESCGSTVNVSRQILPALKSMGQIVRKVQSGFMATCGSCSHRDNPILKKINAKDYTAVCRKCGEDLKMNKFAIKAMEDITGYKEGERLGEVGE